nr:MAG: DNA pilot protein [Microvirus sp.]
MGLFSGILGTVGTIFGGPIGGAIGGLAGGLFDEDKAESGVRDQNAANLAIARETNAFNAEEALKNREFQREMSGTAWQRGTADMQKAGINPMLAFAQGGASSPSGSSASGISARMENAKAAQLEVAFRTQELKNQTNVANSQAELNRAAAVKAAAETVTTEATAKNVDASTDKIRQEIPKIKADTDNAIEQASKARADAMNADARTALAKVETVLKQYQIILTDVETQFRRGAISYQEAQTALAKASTAVANLEAMIRTPEAKKSDTWFGEAIPYLKDLRSVIPMPGVR